MRPPAIAIASLLAAPANALPECPPNRAGADLSGVDLFNAKPVNADLAVAELTLAKMEGAIGLDRQTRISRSRRAGRSGASSLPHPHHIRKLDSVTANCLVCAMGV